MILKIICTIAFFAPTGDKVTSYEFSLDKYKIEFGTADLAFQIYNDNYSLSSSTGMCTLTQFKGK